MDLYRSKNPLRVLVIFVGLLCFAGVLRCEEPLKVTVCELKGNPGQYNQKLVQVTGFVSHGFEDFGLFDLRCPSFPYVWLEYGGTRKSGTKYCCGASTDRTRPRPLVVEGTEVPLTTNESFDAFDKLIVTEGDTVIRASLVGRFFAGKEKHPPSGNVRWSGYGHMGCCSLLAIQEVLSVAPHNREDLDYRSSPDSPGLEKIKCGYQGLLAPWPYEEWVKAQHVADQQESPTAYDNPKDVAAARLMRLAKVDERIAANLKETSRSQGRIVYEVNTNQGKTTYMVIVSKPYVLSFFAKDSQKVAWVVTAVYKSWC
jgi:hypothetical protein